MPQSLFALTQELATLTGISALLGWDQETKMPAGAIESRGVQSALIAEISHAKFTSNTFKNELGQWINLDSGELINSTLSADEAKAVRLIYKDWKKATTLPTEFVGEMAALTTKAQSIWADARATNSFSTFAPVLDEIIQLQKKKADLLGWTTCRYDALLDEYEPEFTTADYNALFTPLKSGTISLLNKIKLATPPPFKNLTGNFSIASQSTYGHALLHDIGFDFTHGRLDASTHPFSTNLHPTDVRITTRYKTDDILDNISSTLHEAGHGMYEQGLETHWFGTPLCEAISLGVHESQSRFWENIVGRSRGFFTGQLPAIATQFGAPFDTLNGQDLYRAANQVTPSFIRVESDELTYNLHILIRFEMEQAMINDSISVSDLPDLWNQKYHDYLGITPETDTVGILQDVHWSAGLFGYFPTYSLGKLVCGHLAEAIATALPDFDSKVEQKQFGPILTWLRHHVHQVGRRQSTRELVKTVCNASISADPFLRYANQKFSDIYELN